MMDIKIAQKIAADGRVLNLKVKNKNHGIQRSYTGQNLLVNPNNNRGIFSYRSDRGLVIGFDFLERNNNPTFDFGSHARNPIGLKDTSVEGRGSGSSAISADVRNADGIIISRTVEENSYSIEILVKKIKSSFNNNANRMLDRFYLSGAFLNVSHGTFIDENGNTTEVGPLDVGDYLEFDYQITLNFPLVKNITKSFNLIKKDIGGGIVSSENITATINNYGTPDFFNPSAVLTVWLHPLAAVGTTEPKPPGGTRVTMRNEDNRQGIYTITLQEGAPSVEVTTNEYKTLYLETFMGLYSIEFAPPLTKTNEESLTLSIDLSGFQVHQQTQDGTTVSIHPFLAADI